MVDGSEEAQTVPFLVILRVLVAYLQFYFRLQVSCKVDFEERTYVALSLRYSEAVSRCSVKKMFLEISQNSQENTCTRDSFLIKLQAYF